MSPPPSLPAPLRVYLLVLLLLPPLWLPRQVARAAREAREKRRSSSPSRCRASRGGGQRAAQAERGPPRDLPSRPPRPPPCPPPLPLNRSLLYPARLPSARPALLCPSRRSSRAACARSARQKRPSWVGERKLDRRKRRRRKVGRSRRKRRRRIPPDDEGGQHEPRWWPPSARATPASMLRRRPVVRCASTPASSRLARASPAPPYPPSALPSRA